MTDTPRLTEEVRKAFWTVDYPVVVDNPNTWMEQTAQVWEISLKAALAAYDRETIQLLRKELALERLRVAGLGVIAMCNTPESAKANRITRDNPLWCASFGDVERIVDSEMALRSESATLRKELERMREGIRQNRNAFQLLVDKCKETTTGNLAHNGAQIEGLSEAQKAYCDSILTPPSPEGERT